MLPAGKGALINHLGNGGKMANGGDRITGNTGDDSRNAAVGKDIQQVSIYSDTFSWREFVRRDLVSHGERLDRLETRIMAALFAIMLIFFLGAISIGLVIRQFDLTYLQMERSDVLMERRMERLERMIPTPTPWMWPGNVP
jgi:hypothetical protein